VLVNSRQFQLRNDPTTLENIVLPHFLEGGTRYRGPKQKEIAQTILFRYFNRVDISNISDISLRFINVSDIKILFN
jgi:hypothetical protein